MSKISCDFKLKDLYAIKHALENLIDARQFINYSELLQGKDKEDNINDIDHEKKIVDYIVDIINKYKSTEVHYK